MAKTTFQTSIAGKPLSVEVGELAPQADAAVRAQYGETVVLATVVMAKEERQGADFFPLTVDFDEKFYAAGRIKGSRWIKREGRPSEEAILTNRLIDRTIRPLFNQRMRYEVQVIITALSFDNENDPDLVALFATSLALGISKIPWNGPVGAVRVGMDQAGNFIVNPRYEERASSSLDLVLSGPATHINMVEARALELPEETVTRAFVYAEEERKKLIAFQNEIIAKIGSKKREGVKALQEDLRTVLQEILGTRAKDILFTAEQKSDRNEKIDELRKELISALKVRYDDPEVLAQASTLFEEELDRIVHETILSKKRRPDGRAFGELRPLSASVGLLPRTHGSGLFSRGQTQALSVLTLGAPGLEQSLETMETVGTKRFLHHYNFPPFSTGETGRVGFPGRREIGHGALAEKAIEPLIPPKEKFPYVIRIVTEILSSNGSTSMASVCGSTLALMDAGVPIERAVAGISIGLISKDTAHPEKEYVLLTDIEGLEDHHGDMDFKVAGTEKGITAIQLDCKIVGLTQEIIEETCAQAKEARIKILEIMQSTIAVPRADLSPHAPRVITVSINPERIRDVIGPGGKVINQITGETGVTIDIEDSGLIFITSLNKEEAEKAREWILNLTREVVPGEVFKGKVMRLLNFGAFVEILPGQQGLVHVSELSHEYIAKVDDVVKVGDIVEVKVKNIDAEGRINLSMKDLLPYSGDKKGSHPTAGRE